MKYLLLTFLLAFHFLAISQKYNFRYFGPDEGLPQQSVLSMLSDRDGILRLGTQGGFCSFDGKTFSNLSQKDGLNSNHVTSIYQDRDENFWLGHRYDAPTFVSEDTVIALQGGWSDSIRSSTSEITRCGDKVWFITEKEGLFFYDLTTEKVKPFRNEKLKGLKVTALLSVGEKLIIGSERGVFEIENESLRRLDNPKLNEKTVVSIKSDQNSNNAFYVLTKDDLLKFYLTDKKEVLVDFIFSRSKTKLSSWKNFLIVSQNEFWIYSVEGAINLKDLHPTLYTTENGLGMNHVESMVLDREGNVWFGLHGQGLYQLLGEDFLQINESIGLIDNKVTGICAYENEVWVSTEGGLSRVYFHSDRKEEIDSIENYSIEDELIDVEASTITCDEKGNFFIVSMNGVVYYSRREDQFVKFHSEQFDLTKFNMTLEIDDENNIWLGSLSQGITKFRINEQGLPSEIQKFNSQNGFFSDQIWKIFCDSKGRIWIGSNNNGLVKYQNGNFQHFGLKEGLTNERPGSITEDIYGDIWLGTIGGGVFRYDGQFFQNFNSNDGIQADNPYFVAADDIGNIWIGSNKGVDRLNIKSGKIDFFGKLQGFRGVETNQNAFFKDENGTMWFGTIGGVMQCYPKKIKASKTPPLIFIEGVRIYLKKMDLSEGTSLEHNENHITFDFKGIHYSSPEEVNFSFKLKGFDNDWSPKSKENAATYSNLPPGEYQFLVKAQNRSGVWSEPAEFSIRITPPFWATWWFKVLVVIVLIASVFLVFRARTKKLRKQREFLKLKVNQRTQQLREEKDKVQQFNQKLSAQNRLLAIKNKDITDSIRYAERIQNGMLPGEREVSEILPNSFIMFLPRDIVSGDFYWCMKKNDITCFAAIDCTGHGVPGAFMSLIGNDLLNQVGNNPDLDSTGKLLTAMHSKLKEYFLKEGGVNLNDGMDMALCAIKPNAKLEFSGAKRPLYLVRDNEVIVYKGDRYSIGENVEENVVFSTTEITLEEGDMLYIFSDGYQDQFGGENEKKFMVKQLRNLLVEISNKPVDEQRQILLDTFYAWKANHDQVDDVLIWGVRI